MFFSILLTVHLAFANEATNADLISGKKHLDKGATETAHTKFKRARQSLPSSKLIHYYYAITAPAAKALLILDTLTKSDTPDTIRAKSFLKLGDYYYVTGNFTKASEYFQNSYRISNAPESRHKWALALCAAGDVKTARSIWHIMSVDNENAWKESAQYHLCALQVKLLEYNNAYGDFLKYGFSQNSAFNVAALAGKIICTNQLGMNDKEAQYRLQFKKISNPLEKQLIQSLTARSVKTQTGNVSDTETSASSPYFTLQVGAFGSEANAIKFKENLEKKHTNILIEKTMLSENTLFRVQLGKFNDRASAEQFAEQKLSPDGIGWRVMQK